jgi:fido (protein-threonine AMPylation protein)
MCDEPAQNDPHYDWEHRILRNLRGLTQQQQLDLWEARESGKALLRLAMEPVHGGFDRAHL